MAAMACFGPIISCFEDVTYRFLQGEKLGKEHVQRRLDALRLHPWLMSPE